jgi:lipid-binding SYLF domain-containing protein
MTTMSKQTRTAAQAADCRSGAQAGGAGGSFAMLLMNERATDAFRNKNAFALNADAGLTIVDYSADTQASAGRGDAIIWSDTVGLFAGASIGVSGIVRDEDENLRTTSGRLRWIRY